VPRGGRYRMIPVGLWENTEFQRLTPNARYVYMNLTSGSLSSFAGIGLLYIEALQRETGLRIAELENALAELEKTPTPARSWIVRDLGVVWVRRQLMSDPAIEKAGGSPSAAQQIGIATHLGSLPQDSAAVRKFRRYHSFTGTCVALEASRRAMWAARGTVPPDRPYDRHPTVPPTDGGSPEKEIGKGKGDRKEETGKGERERGNQDVTHVTGSNNGGHRVRREDAPLEWFNDCAEGRRRRCVKTAYFDHVDLPDSCVAHAKARHDLKAKS
jgi:hypothetical protein